MRGWKQGDMFLARQESRDCFDFISDVGIRGIYLSLALGTAKFKQLDIDKSCSLSIHYIYYIDTRILKNCRYSNRL